jgi:type IV pilus assembly protein PilZ
MSEGRRRDPKDEADSAVDMDPSAPAAPSASAQSWLERRSSERFDVTWSVDCETEETFLYAAITNISELGIFVRTTDPLPIGTQLTLRFVSPNSASPFVLQGKVQWVNTYRPMRDNPNPGMGVRFIELQPADRERLVDTIRTIAYLRGNIEPALN